MSIFTDNPVFWKEVRSRARGRRRGGRASRIALFVTVGLSVLVLYWFGARGILAARSANAARDLFVLFVTGIEVTLLLFLVPSLAAGAITQEREQQTWNALLLSRLRPYEIVSGKYLAALVPPLLVLALFAPLNLLAAVVANLPAADVLLSGLHLTATLLFYAAVGLFCSWACRRTFVATAAAFSVTGFFVVGTPILFALAEIARSGNGTYIKAENFVPLWLNPYMPLVVLLDSRERVTMPILVYIQFCLLGALLLLLVVVRRLAKGPKELEQ